MAKAPSFFSKVKPNEFTIENLSGNLNTAFSDLDIKDTDLSGGQNMIPASDTSIKKRPGISLFGPFLGPNPITGGFNFVNQAGTQRQLVCYNTSINIHTSTSSTPISGITLTQGTLCDGTYFPFTDKFYVLNGIDNVAKIANDGTGDQSDSSFKKGKYITTFMNRLLVANTSANPNRVWYTDLEVDTFSSNNWFDVSGAITGIIYYYSKVLIFTKRKIYRIENFTFDGTSNWVSQLFELPVEFGSIVEGTIKVVNGYVYFLGQDMNDVAAIYQCDGYSAVNITNQRILNTMQGLSGSQLNSAFAANDGGSYRVYVALSGSGTNNAGIVYDTIKDKFYTIEKKWLDGIADFSYLWSSETSGVWSVYAGTQSIGQVYQLHANDGLYDELPEERYLTTGSSNLDLDSNADKRVAQSFKMTQYDTTNKSVPITQVGFQIKTNGGTPGSIVVRIETDNSGVPSGTLVSSGATTTISPTLITSSYSWVMAKFSSAINVTGNTTYWLVLQQPASTIDSAYKVSADSSGSYASGNAATYSSGWTAVTGTDLSFIIYDQSPIDGYADSKAFLVAGGHEFKLIKYETIFSTVANYSVGVGFQSPTGQATYITYLVSLSSSGTGGQWDDGVSKWDDGVTIWDGTPSRNFTWTDIGALENRTIKQRIRNRSANQQFEYNKTILQLLLRARNV